VDLAVVRSAAAQIQRKLKKVSDPRFDPSSAEFAEAERQRATEKAARKEAKMATKRAEEQKRQNELLTFVVAPRAKGEADEKEFVLSKRPKLSVETASSEELAAEKERQRKAQLRQIHREANRDLMHL